MCVFLSTDSSSTHALKTILCAKSTCTFINIACVIQTPQLLRFCTKKQRWDHKAYLMHQVLYNDCLFIG